MGEEDLSFEHGSDTHRTYLFPREGHIMFKQFWTTGDIAKVTGLTTQAIQARIKSGHFVDEVSRDKFGTRFFDPSTVMDFFSAAATEEMIDYLNIIIRCSATTPADVANAIEVRDGLIDGSTSIFHVVSDLNHLRNCG